MTLPSAANLSTSKAGQQVVAITSIDTVNMKATGYNRQGSEGVSIDLRYHVGAVHVMPMLYEQWIVAPQGMSWVLVSKLPHNTTDLLTEPVPGQVQIGSTGSEQGPLHLNGSQIAVNAPLSVQTTTALTRPDPALYPAGTHIYDTDLGRPIWSNGTDWHDATGRTFYTADCALSVTASTPTVTHWGAYAGGELTITVTPPTVAQQGSHAEATLAVSTDSSGDLRAGLHYIAHAEQIVTVAKSGAVAHEAIADVAQDITALALGTGSRGQGIDAQRTIQTQTAASGEKMFDVAGEITAAPTGGMTANVGADVLDGFISATGTAELAQDMGADADLTITAAPEARAPMDITADAEQGILVEREGELE